MRAPAKPLPENLAEYFVYDETSPSCLRWKSDRYATVGVGPGKRLVVSAGDVAGYRRKDGYWVVKLFEEAIKIHRIIYALHNPNIDLTEIIVDHEDGDSNNNKYGNLKPSSDYDNGKNKAKYKNNSTGVTGIYLKKGNYAGSYVVTWRTLDKKPMRKLFSISKLGNDEAFRQACEHRAKVMEELREQGAGYTDRHGT